MKNIPVKTVEEEDVATMFRQYLNICNQAIERHRDEFPYKHILAAAEAVIGDRPIDLAVYDDLPKGAFTLHMKDKKLTNGGHPQDPKKAWRVNLSYLRQVTEHPEDYIAHPEKLDLDWLKSRMGLL